MVTNINKYCLNIYIKRFFSKLLIILLLKNVLMHAQTQFIYVYVCDYRKMPLYIYKLMMNNFRFYSSKIK